LAASSSTRRPPAARADARLRARRQRRVAAACGLLAAVLAAGLAIALPARGDIAYGVSVAGVDVGGLEPTAARTRLTEMLGQRLEEPIRVTAGGASTTVVPARLGVVLDVDRTVAAAAGSGSLLARVVPLGHEASHAPVVTAAGEGRLPTALRRLTVAPRDARAVVDRNGNVRVLPAREGRGFDPAATRQAIAAAALAGQDEVQLRPQTLAPAVTTAMASATADEARRLLGGPIALVGGGQARGTLTPAELGPLLTVRQGADGLEPAIDERRLAAVIQRDVAPLVRRARSARFASNGERSVLIPSRPGRTLDVRRTAAAIVAAGLGDERRAQVHLTATPPRLTTAEARALGAQHRISSATTDMGASSANRIHNVHLMADMLDGRVVAPGATFSFNDTVGERTVARGFREGQAIADGLLVPSIGGGVCQVATALFDAAFYGGYPIPQRVNHSFYISHYGLGMDAAVSWGGPDLVFRNDTRQPILIQMSYTTTTLTAEFFSTAPRRVEVEKTVSEPTDVVPAPTRYERVETLSGAETRQTTRGQRGFDVTVTRTVTRDGEVVREDSFRSHYVPQEIVVQVGPDWRPPAPKPPAAKPEGPAGGRPGTPTATTGTATAPAPTAPTATATTPRTPAPTATAAAPATTAG
jgi:vancomycin resistance protein YoaR